MAVTNGRKVDIRDSVRFSRERFADLSSCYQNLISIGYNVQIMISSLSSYDDELLNSAYANVSLIADKTWTFEPEDPYRKLNHSLWVQSCEITEKYKEYGDYRPRLVRDVISESHLAKYGNYKYNEHHERTYRSNDGKSSGGTPHHFHSASMDPMEPWMLPEVQEHFTRLILPSCTRSYQESSAMQILKCNAARRDNEAFACPNFQSEWNESLKERHRRIDSKGSEKIGLLNESLSNRKSNEKEFREKSSTKTIARYRWYTVESVAEMQLQSRIESDAVRDIWNPVKFRDVQRHHRHHQKQICRQSQQSRVLRQTQPVIQHHPQLYYALQYQPLLLRTEYQRKSPFSPSPPPSPILSPEVPEFFPKANLSPIACSLGNDKERRACQIRYFPSLNNRNCQTELFPFNRPHQDAVATAFPSSRMSVLPATETNVFRSPQEFMQRVVPPMHLQLATSSSSPLAVCTPLQATHDAMIAHRPLQMYEKFLPCTQLSSMTPIPVYQRPIELYQEPMLKRKSHGVDFNNLILLTKNSIKTRRGSSKPTVHQSFPLDSRQSLKTSGHNTQVQWLNKDHYSKKTKEIVTVNTLVSELRSFEEKYECKKADGSWRTAAESPQGQQTLTETSFRLKNRIFGNESSRSRSRKKLFENEKSRCKTLNAEQKDRRATRPLYRDVLANVSNETVIPDVFEKRCDELEHQTMEQYGSSEKSLALKYQKLERQIIKQYENSNVGENKRSMDQDCLDGQRCSGHGHCSPAKGHSRKKGSYFPQTTLLKPKGKSLPNVYCGSSNNDNYQTAITSKSLSALTDGPSKESKNIYRGASGDKIDAGVSVRASSKRRLILMSPFERKSEAKRIMKATKLRDICSFSKAKRNVFGCCRTSEIAQIGNGRENLAIIQSPSTEVWLSGFWTT